MSVQDLYFRTLGRICAAMSGFSDAPTAEAFKRLGQTFALLDLRLAGTQSLTVDRKGSGLPILKEVVSVMLDIRNGVDCTDDPAEMRRLMLDYMMAKRRRPEPAMLSRMGRSLYARTIRENDVSVFETEPLRIALDRLYPDTLDLRCGWDFWDGVSASPVTVRCGFAAPSQPGPDVEPRLVSAARLFSGAQFKPVTLANEIDERIPEIRLKELVKLTVGPFQSDVFTETEGAFAPFLAMVEDNEQAWTMSWTVETLRSAGTARRGGGFFSSPKPYEMFAVDTLDLDRATRGVSDFDVHTLMPHVVFQMLADSPEGVALLQGRRVHVLTGHDNSLTEDV